MNGGSHGGPSGDPSCSFCGKNRRDVKGPVAGREARICDECVGLCGGILAEEAQRERCADVAAGVPDHARAAAGSARRRSSFAASVRAMLAEFGVGLCASELGRDASGAVWILSARLPSGSFMTFLLPVLGDPFAPAAEASAARRVVGHLRDNGLLAAAGGR